MQTREDIARRLPAIPAPVMPLWGGPHPPPTPDEYGQLGARIALYPTVAATVGLNASWKVLNDFYERGPAAQYDFAAEIRASKWGPVDQHKLVGLNQVREIEERFLPERERRDYEHTWGHASVLAPKDRS